MAENELEKSPWETACEAVMLDKKGELNGGVFKESIFGHEFLFPDEMRAHPA